MARSIKSIVNSILNGSDDDYVRYVLYEDGESLALVTVPPIYGPGRKEALSEP